jgi:hypothetical protein
MSGHVAGERFVLIEAARLRQIATTPADVGQLIEMRASGLGDAGPAGAALAVEGRAILPPSPVHPRMTEISGDLHIAWVRRSRLGWLWRDLADAPLAEEREAYRVTVMAGSATLRETETGVPAWTYAAADRAENLVAAGGDPVRVEIRQLGTFGPSQPLVLPIS